MELARNCPGTVVLPGRFVARRAILASMGKVHRIKRSFRRIVSQQPIQTGTYSLGKVVTIHLGRSYAGSLYVVVYGNHYEKLVQKLMREYNDGAV